MESFDFCKMIAQDSERSDFSDRDWNNSTIWNSQKIFDEYLQSNRKLKVTGTDTEGNKVDFCVELKFENDCDFDYFTSDYCVSDSTALFLTQLIEKCVQRVSCGGTYCNRNIPPQNGCKITYTIGDFVIIDEYDENGDKFTPKDKSYMRSRFTVMLPLKYEIDLNYMERKIKSV